MSTLILLSLILDHEWPINRDNILLGSVVNTYSKLLYCPKSSCLEWGIYGKTGKVWMHCGNQSTGWMWPKLPTTDHEKELLSKHGFHSGLCPFVESTPYQVKITKTNDLNDFTMTLEKLLKSYWCPPACCVKYEARVNGNVDFKCGSQFNPEQNFGHKREKRK